MAEGKDIPLIISVDTAKSIKTIGELKKGIADTRKELEKTEVGSKRFDELSASIKTAEGRLGDLNKKATALKDMPGPIGAIAAGFAGVKTAVMTGARALMTFTGLLAATGIGLLLVAVGSLMAYFKGTEEGAQRLRVIMAVFNGVVSQLKDVLISLGKAMFDAFTNPKQTIIDIGKAIKDNVINRIVGFIEIIPAIGKAISLALKGEFAEAAKVTVDATAKMTLGVENYTDKVSNAAKESAEFARNLAKVAEESRKLEESLNRVILIERELKVERAEANKLLAEQRFIAQDTTVAIEDRIKALQRASDIEDTLTKNELENEKERLRIMDAKAKQANSDEATLDAIADQRVKVANIEEQSMMRQRMLLRTINSLRNAEAAEAKRIADEAVKSIETRLKAEADLRQQLRDSEINLIRDAEQQELIRNREAFSRKLKEIKGDSDTENALRKTLAEEFGMAEQAIRAKYVAIEDAEKEKKKATEAERKKAEADLRQQLRDSEIALITNAEQQELERSAEAFQRRMDAIIGESEIEGELRDSLLDERLAAEQAIKQKYIDLEAAAEKKRKADLISAEEKLKAAKIQAAQAVASTLSAIGSAIQGESEAAVTAKKVLAIAQIAIDTATAISGAISGGMTLPFPGNIAAVATGIATVIANIASAVSTLNGANVGGGSAPSPPSAASVSAPVIAPVTTNTTQLGNTEQAELAPIQAYVVETQITGSQGNVNQIESQATFGGG